MEARFCGCNCGASLAGLRADALYASEACSKRARRAASPDKARTDHPLQVVRDDQAQKKHNRDLGGLIKQAIVDQIKTTGECHADDLIGLYPEGEVNECRRLASAQFGSMAARKLIRKDGWRPTENAARKGGGGWIWKFTEKGRAQFVGVGAVAGPPSLGTARGDTHSGDSSSAGVPTAQAEGGAATDVPSCASTGAPATTSDPGVDRSPAVDVGAEEPLSLLPEPPKAGLVDLDQRSAA